MSVEENMSAADEVRLDSLMLTRSLVAALSLARRSAEQSSGGGRCLSGEVMMEHLGVGEEEE